MIANAQHLGSNPVASVEGLWNFSEAETGPRAEHGAANPVRTCYLIQNLSAQPLPTPRARRKARAAINGLSMRAGDVFQSSMLCFGTPLGFEASSFASLNVVFTAAWSLLARCLSRWP